MSEPRRIMLVDDDATTLNRVGDALYQAAYSVQLCQYPTLALPTARSFRPDVLVLDVTMPVLNGYEVARSIKGFPELANTLVIFLTGTAEPRDDLRALMAGASDIWRKPFTESHLRRLHILLERYDGKVLAPNEADRLANRVLTFFSLEKTTGSFAVNPGTPFEGRAQLKDGELIVAHIGPLEGRAAVAEMLTMEDGVWRFETGPSRSSHTPVPISVSTEGYKPRVLLVDDEADLRKLAGLQLQRAGFEVVTADDGDDGHRKARSSDFDAVVADLNMPMLDGWGMLKLLKADPRTREVPVIFLSAHDDYRETLKAARAGAHDYLPKTGKAEVLVTHVKRLVQPRLAAHAMLSARSSIEDLELSLVGPIWLCRILGELEASFTLHAADEWGRYAMTVQRGRMVKASAQSGPRAASGELALMSLLVSRGARAVLAPISGYEEISQPLLLDSLTAAMRRVSELERKVTERRLETGGVAQADPGLYDLYLRIASSRDARIARALCEEKIPIEKLAEHVGFPADEVRASIIELVRRGVVSLDQERA
jgi:DNA-binding response OmpR family regulator